MLKTLFTVRIEGRAKAFGPPFKKPPVCLTRYYGGELTSLYMYCEEHNRFSHQQGWNGMKIRVFGALAKNCLKKQWHKRRNLITFRYKEGGMAQKCHLSSKSTMKSDHSASTAARNSALPINGFCYSTFVRLASNVPKDFQIHPKVLHRWCETFICEMTIATAS